MAIFVVFSLLLSSSLLFQAVAQDNETGKFRYNYHLHEYSFFL